MDRKAAIPQIISRISMKTATHTMRLFLDNLGIKYSQSTLTYFEEHPDHPSLISTHQMFEKLGVDGLALSVTYVQLCELPKPCLIPVKISGGFNYFVVNHVSNESVVVLDDNGSPTLISKDIFSQVWMGVAFIVDQTKGVIENNYFINKAIDVFKKSRIYVSAFSFLLLLFASVKFIFGGWNYNLAFLFAELLGLFFTIPILIKVFDEQNVFVHKLCSPNRAKRIDCDSILDSKYSKVFGLVSWAEIGFVFLLSQSAFTMISNTRASTVFYSPFIRPL